jgi:hypothetical protein
MRRRILIAAAGAAAITAALILPISSASADGTTVISAGPAQYSIGFQHPTGTISVAGGTISARCSAASFKGSAVFKTPRCVTRTIKCPVTATAGCSVIWTLQENAVRGPVAVAGQVLFSGSVGAITQIQPYNCPQPNTCGLKWKIAGISAGETMTSSAFNIVFNPSFPSLFDQLELTPN